MTSVYTQTAQQLFEKFQTYISRHGMISGSYGDILHSIGFPHRELVAHGTTLFDLSHLFAKEGISFEYTYADEDGYDTGEQITLQETPYYEDVHISMAISVALTRKVAEVSQPTITTFQNQPFRIQEIPKSHHLETAEQLFGAFQQLFSAFLSHRSRQGEFSHSGSIWRFTPHCPNLQPGFGCPRYRTCRVGSSFQGDRGFIYLLLRGRKRRCLRGTNFTYRTR